ncbi:DNA-binding SARP family transcriptional activator [Wenyingzhuangia heitensis]|uniref:DNA-binding SARP family transcriptional activator n=1 Tax=Wenyingzhuangia heitensis TaxID=1487859 RepID=A0ABX0UEQ3_9FLAO|nr:LamG-like jellyroll fold domain-containing protein [Wenyingzhuangia heitensis]NIJ45926.1 DNA-binding SARP family transcriptional activator [Wenyingzhuangia heitensis]
MKFVKLLFLIFILNTKLGAQKLEQPVPFYSDDLFTLSQNSTNNLAPYDSDVVRGKVARFMSQSDKTLTLKNKREKEISLSFWFLPKDLEIHSGTLLGENELFYFRYLSNRKFQFNHYLKDNVNTASILSDNIWQHIGFTLNSSGYLIIYYNGEAVLKKQISSTWWQYPVSDLIVGKDKYGVNAEGCIDRLKIWDTCLNEEQFKEEYQATLLQANLSNKLQVYLPLNGSLKDVSSASKTVENINQVRFINDPVKGDVANFKNKDSYLRVKDVNFQNQITISAWVKTKYQKEAVGIAGNKDFSFRFHRLRQSLWFNIPMMFNTKSAKAKTKLRDWVHTAITINYNHKAVFYINGQCIDSKAIVGNTGKENYLEIGKSLWEDYFTGQMSQFALWNKVLTPKEIRDVYEGKLEADLLQQQKAPNYSIIYSVGFVLALGLVLWFVVFKKSKRKRAEKTEPSLSLKTEFSKQNALYFFDKFKAFDKQGNDVSYEFTPTLIRLFVLVLVFPKLTNRQISSKELSNILWENDNAAQQKNNRGTNIHRLRKLLANFDEIVLKYENREWMFEISDQVFIDLPFFYEESIDKIVSYPFKSLELCDAIKINSFDSIIAQLNDFNLEKLKEQGKKYIEEENWEQLQKVAKLSFSIDSLNEVALAYQIKSLLHLGKKQDALKVYQNFSNHYKSVLNDDFKTSFDDFLTSLK